MMPDREHVGAEVERLALDELGRHVRRRAEELAGDGHALQVDDLRDAEVHQLEHAVLADHDVLGLDVAVDDAGGVRVRERAADLDGDQRRDLREGERARGQELLERLAVDELGDDVRARPNRARSSRRSRGCSRGAAWRPPAPRAAAAPSTRARTARCWCRILIATSRLSVSSIARYTTAMPPWPTSWRSRYRSGILACSIVPTVTTVS